MIKKYITQFKVINYCNFNYIAFQIITQYLVRDKHVLFLTNVN